MSAMNKQKKRRERRAVKTSKGENLTYKLREVSPKPEQTRSKKPKNITLLANIHKPTDVSS